ncbi:MAG: DUF2156 domain-containing protein [Clostridiales bacterium]|nr:DUF2156 domain-containing protein [Clostridiales bacterium]
MESCFRAGHRGSLEYSFSSLFIWRDIYKLYVARMGGYAIVLSNMEDPAFVFPQGTGPLLPVLQALMAYTKKRELPLRFNTILQDDRARLEALFPGEFEIEEIRWAFDYIYETERLATLAGRKLSSKRNHINKFMKTYRDWTFEKITQDNIEEARAMHRQWCAQVNCAGDPGLAEESCVVKQAFQHFFALGFDGGLLRVNGKVAAFAIGDPLNDDVYLVHIEKADNEIPGAYQMINQQFVQAFCRGYRFVNREDDTGDEGLRRAKMSYDPAYLVAKYAARQITP